MDFGVHLHVHVDAGRDEARREDAAAGPRLYCAAAQVWRVGCSRASAATCGRRVGWVSSTLGLRSLRHAIYAHGITESWVMEKMSVVAFIG